MDNSAVNTFSFSLGLDDSVSRRSCDLLLQCLGLVSISSRTKIQMSRSLLGLMPTVRNSVCSMRDRRNKIYKYATCELITKQHVDCFFCFQNIPSNL